MVSFYSKIIISLLSVENGAFLNYLENSEFLERCFENLEYCSIFELLCTIPNCLPFNEYKVKVKQVNYFYFLKKKITEYIIIFIQKLP